MLKPYMAIGSFVFVAVMITAIVFFFLQYFEPEIKDFSLTGIAVKVDKEIVGVRLYSGIIVFVHHVENADSYKECIASLRGRALPVEISFRQSYYRFTGKCFMSITSAGQDFRQPALTNESAIRK